MTPPEAPDTMPGNTPPAVSVCLETLRKRSSFLAAARAGRQRTVTMMVQARNRRDDDPRVGVGFTCSKKVGNAVARNRAKRRLREVARMVLPQMAKPGWDYVLIGRPDTTGTAPFEHLMQDFKQAITHLHKTKK